MNTYSKPSEIKVGVIGYGGAFNMGRKHLQEMKAAGMTPYAVCEVDPARLEVARTDWPGIETYHSLEHMLKKSEVNLLVHITPHNLHYPLAVKCVKAGKHVVTEKPFVLTTREADGLIALAKKHRVMVSTYHNRHWDGWIMRAVDQVVRKKIIGEVIRVEAHMGSYGLPGPWWRSSKSISGGVLYDWGVHLLEYSLQLIDSDITEVSGFAHTGYWASQAPASHPWKKDMNEDQAHAIVRFKNGVMLHLSNGHLRTEPRPYILGIFGTRGAYLLDFEQWTTRLPKRQKDGKYQFVEKTGKHPEGRQHLFYRNIAEHLCGKADLIITPEWARRPIHILDLADQSARLGKTLKAKYR